MTRKAQNSCRHFRAVPSSHTERAPISSSFIVSVPSDSPPQYTELSRTVLNLQLIVLTIQPATTSSSADGGKDFTSSADRRQQLFPQPSRTAAVIHSCST